MAALLVFTITTHREIRVLRKRGEHVERMAGRRLRHLGTEFPEEGRPLLVRLRGKGCFHELRARREEREPDVVPVEAGKVFLWHTARGTAHGAQPRALVCNAGGSESDDANAHRRFSMKTSVTLGDRTC